ncbi:MAG: O-antigen ligase family protein [Candidatus Nealsonbacteria bacterium]|nr:O-antigen ligase family protein [Candidatus Nealsonbacteria bacterium]
MNKFNNIKELKIDSYSVFLGKLLERMCLFIIKIGTYLILFTPIILSGKFFFPFVGPKSLYFFGLSEIIFLFYVILAIFYPKYRPKLNILLIAIIVFIIASIVSSVFGADFSQSFWSKYERMTGLLMWFHLFTFFIVVSSVFKRKDWFRIFEFSIMVSILIGFLMLLGQTKINPLEKMGLGTRGGATLGNSSFLATYLMFNAFFALYLFVINIGKKNHNFQNESFFSFIKIKEFDIFYPASFIFLVLCLLLSTGRAAAIAFFCGMILIFLLKIIFYEKGILKIAAIIILTVTSLSFAVVLFFSIQLQDNFVQKFLLEKVGLSAKARLYVWETGWNAWLEKPLLGWGPENFHYAYFKNFNPKMLLPEAGADLWYDRAHNIVVDLLVSNGIIGFFSYLGILGAVFYVSWKKYFTERVDFSIAVIFSAALIAYFIQNLTVFDMVNSLVMFFLILGFIGSVASERKKDFEKKLIPPNPLIILIIFVVFCFSFFNFVIQPLRADNYTVVALKSSNIDERVSLYKKTLAISSLGRKEIRETFTQYASMLSQQELSQQVPEDYQKKELDFAIDAMKENIKEQPLLYTSYLSLGRLYNIYGRFDSSKFDLSEEVLKKAIEIGPGNQQGYWALAQTELFKNKPEEAMSLAKKAIDLEPRAERSHLVAIQIAQIIARVTGNTSFVQERVDEALKINPDWRTDIEPILKSI